MTETETLYSILLDGKHSIVGTWEGELVRDNFAITVKKSRGENRGVVITTHKNLKNYQRTKTVRMLSQEFTQSRLLNLKVLKKKRLSE